VTSTYRSFSQQVATRARFGAQAAPAGQSNHGLGLAVDFQGGIQSFGTRQFNWMRQHAHEFGWEHPSWARWGGANPEAWHWEFDTHVLHRQGEVNGFWLGNPGGNGVLS
jgi:LAS superfamily LD-carboxypeptidase LdcB